MREIKFRAWDKDLKKMCEDFLSLVEDAIYQHQGNPWRDERFTPMQFTGLKDKNGRDIYEGDIVKTHHVTTDNNGRLDQEWDEIGEVVFENLRITIANKRHGNFYSFHLETEVIGNIYESSELLD
jgi:uncharacterized phage protein (TIGR01671 family)